MSVQNVKTILGINDNLQDDVLNLLHSNASAIVLAWFKHNTKLTSVPTEMEFVVDEITIKRYNRMGAEGYSSKSIEGKSISFSEDDLSPYLSILNIYIDGDSPTEASPGKVMFF